MKLDSTCFNWIECILKSDLPPHSRHLAHYLSTFMNSKHDVAWPSLSKIIRETRLSRKTVCKYIAELEESGWIKRDKGGPNKNTKYYIAFPKMLEESLHHISQMGSGAGGLGVVAQGNTNKPIE